MQKLKKRKNVTIKMNALCEPKLDEFAALGAMKNCIKKKFSVSNTVSNHDDLLLYIALLVVTLYDCYRNATVDDFIAQHATPPLSTETKV